MRNPDKKVRQPTEAKWRSNIQLVTEIAGNLFKSKVIKNDTQKLNDVNMYQLIIQNKSNYFTL